ncbi:MAG: hypothetical protein NVS3B25_00800 [Hymenobacter sp.]
MAAPRIDRASSEVYKVSLTGLQFRLFQDGFVPEKLIKGNFRGQQNIDLFF